jgi:two-component system, cell cycle response regulator DivK
MCLTNIGNEKVRLNRVRPLSSEHSPLVSNNLEYFLDFVMAHYPKRILVVEDNKLDMRLLKDILEGSGYETLQAADGLEAIDLASASLPDLILMDIQLPEISGLEITRRLKGDDRSRRIPIVAVTAFAMGWHEREALDSGCDAYISKPISVLGFLNTVESFLSRLAH